MITVVSSSATPPNELDVGESVHRPNLGHTDIAFSIPEMKTMINSMALHVTDPSFSVC